MKAKKQAEKNGTPEELQEKERTEAKERETPEVKVKKAAEAKKEKPKKEKTGKETVKKTPKKAAVPAFYIQYEGYEISGDEIADKVKALWKADGQKLNTIKSMNLYVKPEEHAVYYVINEEFKGHINL